jgi:hypothetical protein
MNFKLIIAKQRSVDDKACQDNEYINPLQARRKRLGMSQVACFQQRRRKWPSRVLETSLAGFLRRWLFSGDEKHKRHIT